jgi:formylmethanofuran dehydrogenase subunit E
MKTKWFFSLVSGELFEVPQEETHLLDSKQVPLKQKPDDRCSKCRGRLYTNYYITGNRFDMCKRCAKKYIDTEFLNSKLINELQTNNQ